ncbi:MAG: VPLPA-CTERM sorting domain-containing protein [Pikeienuella sp.]
MPTRLSIPAAATVLFLSACSGNAAPVLFAVDAGTDELLSIDPNTGRASAIGRVEIGGVPVGGIRGLAFGPDGTLYGVDGFTDRLVIIDTETGQALEVGIVTAGGVDALAFRGDTLFGVTLFDGRLTDTLVSIDTTTAMATEVGLIEPEQNRTQAAHGLAATPDGTLFYTNQANDLFYEIDLEAIGPTTDASKLVGSHRPDPETDVELLTLTAAPNGTLYATDFLTDTLVTVDRETGALTEIGPLGFGDVRAIAAAPAGFGVVPVPAAGWLLLTGVGTLLLVRRRAQPA